MLFLIYNNNIVEVCCIFLAMFCILYIESGHFLKYLSILYTGIDILNFFNKIIQLIYNNIHKKGEEKIS